MDIAGTAVGLRRHRRTTACYRGAGRFEPIRAEPSLHSPGRSRLSKGGQFALIAVYTLHTHTGLAVNRIRRRRTGGEGTGQVGPPVSHQREPTRRQSRPRWHHKNTGHPAGREHTTGRTQQSGVRDWWGKTPSAGLSDSIVRLVVAECV